MKHHAATLLLLLALCATDSGAQATAPVEPEATAAAADSLREDVQEVVERVERIRGGKSPVTLQASRASTETREAMVESVVTNQITRAQLDARGRAWSDLGLGDKEAPLRILRLLTADLEVVTLDSGGTRLLVSQDVLVDRVVVSDQPDDPSSALLLATGVRPDEPLIAHMAVHVLQRSRERSQSHAARTTDAILARSAWAEGEANLVAIGMLFQGLRLADAVLQPGIDPAEVLGGRLVPAGIAASPPPDRVFLEFVYQEGYEEAIRVFRGGGFRALEQAAHVRATTRDLIHPDRSPLGPPEFPPGTPPGDADRPYRLADEDSLGEQGVFALVSQRTGKDDLALAAADGWRFDRLSRWDPAAAAPAGLVGVTVWETFWGSDEDASEFAYAAGRVIEDGFGGVAAQADPANRKSWSTADRTFRLSRTGRAIVLRVASIADDSFLEGPRKNAVPATSTKKLKK